MGIQNLNLDRIVAVGTGFLSGFAIAAPVGDRARGAQNDQADVRTVQLLLEFAARKAKTRAFDPKGVDGLIARNAAKSSTVKAIIAFQRSFMRNPDGLVEPDGATIRRLRAMADGAEGRARDAARAVMKVPGPADGKPAWLPAAENLAARGAHVTMTGKPKAGPTAQATLPPPATPVKPAWIGVAEEELATGVQEIKGSKHNARIQEYHWATDQLSKKKKFKSADDMTDERPWCASFVGWTLEQAGYESAESSGSQSYRRWGRKVDRPCVGCVAVINYGKLYPKDPKKKGKGHVGFIVGQTPEGYLVMLGGNQRNKTGGRVCYVAYRKGLIEMFRMPKDFEITPDMYNLPVMKIAKGGASFADSR